MDFSEVELSEQDRAFQVELRRFLASVVTDDVIRRDRETGDNFDEAVHLLVDNDLSPTVLQRIAP